MGLDDSCNTGLVLGLGLSPTHNSYNYGIEKSSATVDHHVNPSLTLSLSGESYKVEMTVSGAKDQIYRQTSSNSGISSFSSGRIKRERDVCGDGEEEAGETTKRVVCSRVTDDHEDEEGVSARKKLRLTKQQSARLEENFKLHSTLTPKQKQALARQLNLRPRQVEVWFQNRRARTKLKQTEVDCEFLKKCCDTLTDENRRLQKELQDLKALKMSQPFYMHIPPATVMMCPSCERLGGGSTVAVDGEIAKGAFSIVRKPHIDNPFINPSAAC
ncbi:Homeobox-leucine zipper protein HAT22 [Hirschfeldia incana]|nr:Homeobox-leucine zipper protein HAT22 [Hirschfeldia incana]